jgi:hypothetical protein
MLPDSPPPPTRQQPLQDQGPLIIEASRSHLFRQIRHITLCKTPLDETSARPRDLYLTTHDTHKRKTSMPPAGFKHAIPARERPLTHALDRVATGIGIVIWCDSTHGYCKWATKEERCVCGSIKATYASVSESERWIVCWHCIGKAEKFQNKIMGTENCLQYSLLHNLPQPYCIRITSFTKNFADWGTWAPVHSWKESSPLLLAREWVV